MWELRISICYNNRRGNENLLQIASILHFIRLNCFVGKHPQIQLTYKYLFHVKISFHCFFFSRAFFVEQRRGLSTCAPAENDDHKSIHFTRLKYRLGLQWTCFRKRGLRQTAD